MKKEMKKSSEMITGTLKN